METNIIIEGFENFSVSDFGNVKNNKTGRIMRQKYRKNCYMDICLMKDNKKCSKQVHILTAIAFIPSPDEKSCIDNIDNDKSNNNIANLRWATHSENNQNRTMMSNNTSGVKGVIWDKRSNK